MENKIMIILCLFMPRKPLGPAFPLLVFLPSWKPLARWNTQEHFLIALTFLMQTWITWVCSWREWDSLFQSSPCSQCCYAFLSNDSCKSISCGRDQKTRNPSSPLKTVILLQCEPLRIAPHCRLSLHPTSSSFLAAHNERDLECAHLSMAYDIALSSGETDGDKPPSWGEGSMRILFYCYPGE